MPFLSSIPSGIIAYRKTTCVAVLAQAHPQQYSLEVLHGWRIGVDSLLDYTARPHCFLALMACNDVSNLQPTSREQGGGEKDADFEEDAADGVNTGESDAKDHVETSEGGTENAVLADGGAQSYMHPRRIQSSL